MASVPAPTGSSIGECPICMESMHWNQGIVSTTCGHIFHSACVSSWMHDKPVQQQTCPQCRRKTSEARLTRLYGQQSSPTTAETQRVSLTTALYAQVNTLQADLKANEETNRFLLEENRKLWEAKNAMEAQFKKDKKLYKEETEKVIGGLKGTIRGQRKQLEELESVKRLMSETESEWQREVENQGSSQSRSMACVFSFLKKELQNSQAQRDELNRQHRKDELKISKLELSIKNMDQALKKLVERIKFLENRYIFGSKKRPLDSAEEIDLCADDDSNSVSVSAGASPPKRSRDTSPPSPPIVDLDERYVPEPAPSGSTTASRIEDVQESRSSDGYFTPSCIRNKPVRPFARHRAGYDGFGGQKPLESAPVIKPKDSHQTRIRINRGNLTFRD